MQKRSHKLLASALLQSRQGFAARRFELAFLFGSFQPDCNPLTYFKGFRQSHALQGHSYASTRGFIRRHAEHLQRRDRWNLWHYYTLGKLTHYVADAFTFPHNEHFTDTLMEHHRYEHDLYIYMRDLLTGAALNPLPRPRDLEDAIQGLHEEYMQLRGQVDHDACYILQATGLLMASCPPRRLSFVEEAQFSPA